MLDSTTRVGHRLYRYKVHEDVQYQRGVGGRVALKDVELLESQHRLY